MVNNDNSKMVSIDSDCLDFLKGVYFGAERNPFVAASNRAYRDFNRTLRFNGMPNRERLALRNSVTAYLKSEITALCAAPPADQSAFDCWHKAQCSYIRKEYLDAGIDFTFGHAQKWINMTFKYLFVISDYDFTPLFEYLHVPVDNYIFQIAQKRFGYRKPSVAWSKWDNYSEQYLAFEYYLRDHITGMPPLRWEFKNWIEEARNIISEEK